MNSNFTSFFLCPECRGKTTVTDSRQSPAGQRRRRLCAQGHRFTTYETIPGETPVREIVLNPHLSVMLP